MIVLPPLWAFVVLLGVHYVADLILQSHWMASNKSKDNRALAMHVGVYSAALLAVTGLLFAPLLSLKALGFVALNGALHFATDYVTSRWSSRLWAKGEWHNFFLVIGLDQLIHQVTLAVTMAWFFGGAL